MEKMQQTYVRLILPSSQHWTQAARERCFERMKQLLPLYFEGKPCFYEDTNTLSFRLYWPEGQTEALCGVVKDMAAEISGAPPSAFNASASLLENRRLRKSDLFQLLGLEELEESMYPPRVLVRVVLSPPWILEHPDLAEQILREFAQWSLATCPEAEQIACEKGSFAFSAAADAFQAKAEIWEAWLESFSETLWAHLYMLLTPEWEEALELLSVAEDLDGSLAAVSRVDLEENLPALDLGACSEEDDWDELSE